MSVPDMKEIRRSLLADGYEPIPIRGKAPGFKGWAGNAITDARLAEIEAAYADHMNTGIRTGRCAAIDIDITNEAHAAEIEKVIVVHLGETPLRRIGSKGALLCYFNATPNRKITVGTKKKRLVEFLGEGQQFAAYGNHPDTGKPYDWPNDFFGGEPTQTPLKDLPEVTPDQLRAAATAVTQRLGELGYEDLKVTGDGMNPAPPVDGNRRVPSPASGRPTSPAICEAMLRCIPPDDRDDWLKASAGLVTAPVPNWSMEDRLDLFVRWARGDFHGYQPEGFESEDDCAVLFNRDMENFHVE